MRHSLVLCVLLMACGNETNERLARVEKKLDQIQQQPPAVTTASVEGSAPADPGPAEQARSAIKSRSADAFLHQRLAVHVPLRGGPGGLVYQVKPGTTFLYQYDTTTNTYTPIATVPDIIGEDGRAHVTKEQLTDFAHKLGDEPQRATPGHSPLRQTSADECVSSGSGAFIPLASDPLFGMVFATPEGTTILYRWDARQALYVPIADVDPVLGPDHKVSLSDATRTHLQDLLEHVAVAPPPAKARPPFGALQQTVVDDCVEAGVCAFVSLRNDPLFGCVYQMPQQATVLYRWDADKGLYMALTETGAIVGADHRPMIGEVQLAHLRTLLETQ